MKKTNLALIFLILILVSASSQIDASSCCDQTFTIYGKTQGEYSILLWDLLIGGDCYSWYTYVFLFSPDTVRQFMAEYGKGGAGWAYDFIANNDEEPIDTLESDGGVYHLNSQISVLQPPVDSTFDDKMKRLADECYGADIWYKKCPVNCIDYPVFEGCDAKLLYYYKKGLYKNYALKAVYFFPVSNLVIILTNQPYVAIGLDRMDGILIYKISPPTGGE